VLKVQRLEIASFAVMNQVERWEGRMTEQRGIRCTLWVMYVENSKLFCEKRMQRMVCEEVSYNGDGDANAINVG
jgi:hypothetical protein